MLFLFGRAKTVHCSAGSPALLKCTVWAPRVARASASSAAPVFMVRGGAIGAQTQGNTLLEMGVGETQLEVPLLAPHHPAGDRRPLQRQVPPYEDNCGGGGSIHLNHCEGAHAVGVIPMRVHTSTTHSASLSIALDCC